MVDACSQQMTIGENMMQLPFVNTVAHMHPSEKENTRTKSTVNVSMLYTVAARLAFKKNSIFRFEIEEFLNEKKT